MASSGKANRLINATSPYLLQHAYNPVDWYEWSEEALTKARNEDKPILVSIGYSSCHWCHVMEREVFEKENIAGIMNDALICIKVDREERPDIDSVYMEAVQAMGIHGGWPLNVFLTPDQKPFYGGTYFPPDQWVNVIRGIHNAYATRRDEINASAEELTAILSNQETARYKKAYAFQELNEELGQMYSKLAKAFDRKWGGLDKAPKFIMPTVWMWLLRYYKATGNQEALDQLTLTLKKVAWGGVYDQVGGGFARYSVDGYWHVPHFEKMLYDNAQLMTLYAEAYAVTHDPLFKTVVEETFGWLRREMLHPDGGFFSALDADSEGVEGKFYVWTKAEIQQILGADAEIFGDYYNVKEGNGNWEHGNNVLMQTSPDKTFSERLNISEDAWRAKVREWKSTLLAERSKRIAPGLDDKILTSWNAMMVTGLGDAYQYLGDEQYLIAALRTMRFIENELMEGEVIHRSFKDKRSNITGFLDDYALMIQACLKLYQVTFDEYWLSRAEFLTRYVLEQFADKDDGFFYFTSSSSEPLIARRKELFDNVIPSSNSVMVRNLYHLGTLLGNNEFTQHAESLTTSLSHLILAEPNYMSHWGIAYLEMKKGLAEVVFAGEDLREMNLRFHHGFQPFSLTLGHHERTRLPLVENKSAIDGQATIYVCFNKTCQKPVHNIEEAIAQLP